MLVHLGGAPGPAITVVIDDDLSNRVDLETEAARAVPGFLTIAELVGIEPHALAGLRRAVTPGQRRPAAAEALVERRVPLSG